MLNRCKTDAVWCYSSTALAQQRHETKHDAGTEMFSMEMKSRLEIDRKTDARPMLFSATFAHRRCHLKYFYCVGTQLAPPWTPTVHFWGLYFISKLIYYRCKTAVESASGFHNNRFCQNAPLGKGPPNDSCPPQDQ